MNKELYKNIEEEIEKLKKSIYNEISNQSIHFLDERIEDISFLKLVKENIILIPLIQRNYVQGKNQKIITKFIEDIMNAITNNKKLNIDFIFGTKINDKLEIIDGQQRLTTLYLVYWYLFVRLNLIEKIEEMNFIYESNDENENFFELLANKHFCDEVSHKLNKNNNIVDVIKKMAHYKTDIWDYDVTVSSAIETLKVLDEIYQKQYINQISKINTNIEKENIILKKYLVDSYIDANELYIKMNSRGKDLSKFDVLKAKLEEYLQDAKEYEQFYLNINDEWLDMFYKKEHSSINDMQDNSFNLELAEIAEENLYIFLTKYLFFKFLEQEDNQKLFRNSKNQISSLQEHISIEEFEFNTEVSDYTFKFNKNEFIFEISNIMNHLEKYVLNYKNLDYINALDLFNRCLNPDESEITISENLIFYGLLKFLGQDKIIDDEYYGWLRVIRNCVKYIDHYQQKGNTENYSEAFYNIMDLFNEYKKYNDLNLMFNQNESFEFINLYSECLNKEKNKFKLMNNKKWKEAILENDKNKYFEGRNYFLLDFVNNDKKRLNDYLKYSNIINQIFDEHVFKKQVNKEYEDESEYKFLLQRALLTCDEYKEERSYFQIAKNESNDSYSDILTFIPFNNSDNTNTWLKLLNESKEVKKNIKIFIDKHLIYKDNVNKQLEKLIKRYKYNDWKSYFIRENRLFNGAKRGNIVFYNNQCYILYQSRNNCTQWNHITYFLYWKLNDLDKEKDKNNKNVFYDGKFGRGNKFDKDDTLKINVDGIIYYLFNVKDENILINEKNTYTISIYSKNDNFWMGDYFIEKNNGIVNGNDIRKIKSKFNLEIKKNLEL